MRRAKKITVNQKLLQELVPLNSLSEMQFKEVSKKIVIEEIRAGRHLFRKGDRDNQSVYLLKGRVNLFNNVHNDANEVEAGTDICRYPLANQQPRTLSAIAVKKATIARVDFGLLDVFLNSDQSDIAEAVEIGSETNQDWMTRILQSEAFEKIPPSMIQSLLIKMETVPVKTGDVVIQQGDSGNYFYTIHEGRCAVTRKNHPDDEEQLLAKLGEGDSFGEDALLSDVKRNATVSMLTDGLLMRLAKEDFTELLKKPLIHYVDYDQAAAMVDEGAVWVDVRSPDEYKHTAMDDSVNIPLSSLRDELPELIFNSKYVICCDTGRRSESAAFLLSHKGLDVYVLEGGIPNISSIDVDTADIGGVVVDAELDYLDTINNDLALGEYAEHDQELESSHDDNVRSFSEIKESDSSEVQHKEKIEQLRDELGVSNYKQKELYAQTKKDAELIRQLRGELCESGEKLIELYAKVKSDAEEMRLLRDKYAALQEKYKDAVSAHQLELEKLKAQSN